MFLEVWKSRSTVLDSEDVYRRALMCRAALDVRRCICDSESVRWISFQNRMFSELDMGQVGDEGAVLQDVVGECGAHTVSA